MTNCEVECLALPAYRHSHWYSYCANLVTLYFVLWFGVRS